MTPGPAARRKKTSEAPLKLDRNENHGLWLAPDLPDRARPRGSHRSEMDLAWLRNRHQWQMDWSADLLDERDDYLPFHLEDEKSA